MVSGVVSNQQNLSKVGLTLTMRNPGFEIDLWISAQVLQPSPISETEIPVRPSVRYFIPAAV